MAGAHPDVLRDRYALHRPWGGTTGSTYWSGHDRVAGTDVLVQQLTPRIPDGADTSKAGVWAPGALARQVRPVARPADAHLLAVHDVVEEAGALWVVMEPVVPRSLHTLLRAHGRLPSGAAAHIGLEVASALGALHATGAAHGQVDPRGILFREDGTAALPGYGLQPPDPAYGAPPLRPPQPRSQYTAPELADGRARADAEALAPTPQGDLWALGMTLYEMVEGRRLTRGPVPGARLRALRDARPPRARRQREFAPLIEGLLAPHPEARPKTAAVTTALRAAADRQEPVTDTHWALATPQRRTRGQRLRGALFHLGALVGSRLAAAFTVGALAALLGLRLAGKSTAPDVPTLMLSAVVLGLTSGLVVLGGKFLWHAVAYVRGQARLARARHRTTRAGHGPRPVPFGGAGPGAAPGPSPDHEPGTLLLSGAGAVVSRPRPGAARGPSPDTTTSTALPEPPETGPPPTYQHLRRGDRTPPTLAPEAAAAGEPAPSPEQPAPSADPRRAGDPPPADDPSRAGDPARVADPSQTGELSRAADPSRAGELSRADEPAPSAEARRRPSEPPPANAPPPGADLSPADEPAPSAELSRAGDPPRADEPSQTGDPPRADEPAPSAEARRRPSEPPPASEPPSRHEPGPAHQPPPVNSPTDGPSPRAGAGARPRSDDPAPWFVPKQPWTARLPSWSDTGPRREAEPPGTPAEALSWQDAAMDTDAAPGADTDTNTGADTAWSGTAGARSWTDAGLAPPGATDASPGSTDAPSGTTGVSPWASLLPPTPPGSVDVPPGSLNTLAWLGDTRPDSTEAPRWAALVSPRRRDLSWPSDLMPRASGLSPRAPDPPPRGGGRPLRRIARPPRASAPPFRVPDLSSRTGRDATPDPSPRAPATPPPGPPCVPRLTLRDGPARVGAPAVLEFALDVPDGHPWAGRPEHPSAQLVLVASTRTAARITPPARGYRAGGAPEEAATFVFTAHEPGEHQLRFTVYDRGYGVVLQELDATMTIEAPARPTARATPPPGEPATPVDAAGRDQAPES
ncbi:protein kinase [Streptomyces sp. NPDC057702]|uniref:protein kinase domain-containing protein n=1 Tax=unclassified Streptomyces TaxID=2593676 RepID=UPI0036931DCA